MRSTGPILAIGAITVANQSVLGDEPFDIRVLIATGLSAGIFALIEKATGDVAVALAWLALVGVVFVRLKPGTPAPVERLLQVWNEA
jgi:hypothetical protein